MSGLRKRAPCESENSLSDRLYHRIVRDRFYRDKVSAELYRELSLYRDDTPVEEDTEPPCPGPIGRVDFIFKHGTGTQKPYPEFVIEAKRLHVTFPRAGRHSLVTEYVSGDQGMMCFISGRYAPTQRVGAMLGYVFDGKVAAARTEIAAAVAVNSAKLLLKQGTPLITTTLSDIQADETWHALETREFRLFHLLAPV
ncbi:MAG: hypothetical protein LBK99_10555 [Opitutaceae bacterium]|nr:hypothetical protein [Opitutaceae bacterium]